MRNYHCYTVGGEIVAVREHADRSPALYRRTGETTNLRALATADAVIYEGSLLDVAIEDDGLIVLQHPHAGVRERFTPVEWFDRSRATFERVESVFEEGETA